MKKEIVKGADFLDGATAEADLSTAHLSTSGEFLATILMAKYVAESIAPDVVCKAIRTQIKSVNQGDLTQVEGMLLGQAIALQGMFLNLADRAKRADSLEKLQCLTQLALRAQSGSRNTLQTLIESKNPRQVAFFKQTNVAQTQQVNNGPAPPSREKKIKEEPIELLVEESLGSTKMDSGAKAEAGGIDKDMVSVEESHGAHKRGRKAKSISECISRRNTV